MKRTILLLITAPLIAIGCSSSDDSGGGVTSTAGTSALLSVQSKMSDLGNLLPGESTVSSVVAKPHDRLNSIGSNWTTASMPNPQDSGDCSTTPGNVSLKDWMGVEFNESATRCNGSAVNVFGRVSQATGILCALLLNESASTSAGLPSSGTSTITFNSAFISGMETVCGFTSETTAGLASATGTVTYSIPGDTSMFNRKLSLNIVTDDGTMNDVVYIKFTTDGSTSIATNENNSNGTTRTLVTYNSTTKILKAEYISHSTAGQFYIHRLYKDDTATEAQVYTYISDNAQTMSVEYLVAGAPGASTDIAYSMGVIGYGFGSPADGQACINPDTGNITSDGDATCGTFSTVAVSTINAGEDTQTAVHSASSTWNDFATTPAFSWTDTTDMLTSTL